MVNEKQTYLPRGIFNNRCEIKKILDGSLPANPVNDRRVANAVTFKSTFCPPLNQQLLFKKI